MASSPYWNSKSPLWQLLPTQSSTSMDDFMLSSTALCILKSLETSATHDSSLCKYLPHSRPFETAKKNLGTEIRKKSRALRYSTLFGPAVIYPHPLIFTISVATLRFRNDPESQMKWSDYPITVKNNTHAPGVMGGHNVPRTSDGGTVQHWLFS